MVARAIVMTAATLTTHQLYHRWADLETKQWVFYVCTAGLGAVMAAMHLLPATPQPSAFGSSLWAFGCWVALIEALQVFGCGLALFGQAAETDLCIQALGQDGYTALASGIVAAVLTFLRRGRHG